MDTLTYGANVAWEASPNFHAATERYNSTLLSWGGQRDDAWSYSHEMRAMEDSAFANHREPYDEAKSSKPDVFSPLTLSCGGDAYDEAKSFKPESFPPTPLCDNPPACSPAELSPSRSSSSPSLSSSGSSFASSALRAYTPDYFYSGSFPNIGPELARADIKKNPDEFVYSVFSHPNQTALRDRLRDVIGSQWWLQGIQEPRGLLGTFVKRIGPRTFECQSCGKKLPRADRAVDHFRLHIHHRPFKCEGVRGCGDAGCKMAFMTRDCMKSHTAKHEKTCGRCGATVEDKNLGRHQNTRKCKRFGL